MKTLILLPTVLVAALMPMTLSSDDVAADTSAAGIVNAPASGIFPDDSTCAIA